MDNSPSRTPSASSATSARGNPFSIDYILSSSMASAAAAAQKQQQQQQHQLQLQLQLQHQKHHRQHPAASTSDNLHHHLHQDLRLQQQLHQQASLLQPGALEQLALMNQQRVGQAMLGQEAAGLGEAPLGSALADLGQPNLLYFGQQAHPNFLYFMAYMLLQQQQQQQHHHLQQQQHQQQQIHNQLNPIHSIGNLSAAAGSLSPLKPLNNKAIGSLNAASTNSRPSPVPLNHHLNHNHHSRESRQKELRRSMSPPKGSHSVKTSSSNSATSLGLGPTSNKLIKSSSSASAADHSTALSSLSNFVTESLAPILNGNASEGAAKSGASSAKLFKSSQQQAHSRHPVNNSGNKGNIGQHRNSTSTEPEEVRGNSKLNSSNNNGLESGQSRSQADGDAEAHGRSSTLDLISSAAQALKNTAGTAINTTLSKAPPELVQKQPAWVFCTRYSDRPSSGPRTRRAKSKEKKAKDPKAASDEKRPRTAFTSEQLEKLRQEFQANSYLDERRRKDLAERLCLNENQIKIWFQNKRAKMKKQNNQPNPLRGLLVAGGLYNHSTATSDCSESYANGNDHDGDDDGDDQLDCQQDVQIELN